MAAGGQLPAPPPPPLFPDRLPGPHPEEGASSFSFSSSRPPPGDWQAPSAHLRAAAGPAAKGKETVTEAQLPAPGAASSLRPAHLSEGGRQRPGGRGKGGSARTAASSGRRRGARPCQRPLPLSHRPPTPHPAPVTEQPVRRHL